MFHKFLQRFQFEDLLPINTFESFTCFTRFPLIQIVKPPLSLLADGGL